MPNQQSLPFGGELLPTDGSALFIPEFLDSAFADEAFHELMNSTPWEHRQLHMFGKLVDEPRLSTWHSDGVTYTYSGILRTPVPWTPTLTNIRQRCEEQTVHTFNAVLVNLYRDGSDHLSWHADDEPSNGPEPVIASISLGAERKFQLRHNESGEIVDVMLSHGSLLVMSGLSQKCWQHRIPKAPKLSDSRINLTFRHVYSDT